jgi:hypothetical protein
VVPRVDRTVGERSNLLNRVRIAPGRYYHEKQRACWQRRLAQPAGQRCACARPIMLVCHDINSLWSVCTIEDFVFMFFAYLKEVKA